MKSYQKEAKNHFLSGEWSDTQEFHISGDLLVIYMISESSLQLLRDWNSLSAF